MKRITLVLLIALTLPMACARPVTIVTPAGQAAYTADQIVTRINELENAAIQANASGGLPVGTTRLLVEFCVNADKTLKQLPAGWRATVTQAWTSMKSQLPAISPTLQIAVSAVDAVLAAV